MSERRILVHLPHEGLLRHYAEVFGQLVQLGHAVKVHAGHEAVEAAFGALPPAAVQGVTVGHSALPSSRLEHDLTYRLRVLRDVLRFSHPDLAVAAWLPARAVGRVGPGVGRWARRLSRGGWPVARAVIACVDACDRLLPPPKAFERLLDEEQPDLVVVSPGMRVGFNQVDLLKAASRRGIPTAVLIPNWHDLTTKGALGYVPDRLFAWNEAQRIELGHLHRVPPGRVSATGAPALDRWFEHAPGDREAFCARVGLDPRRPYLLYLASQHGIAPGEVDFFDRWLAALRSTKDARLRDIQVLVRPHPTPATYANWLGAEFDRRPGVVVWPRTSLEEALGAPRASADYGDSVRHCALAVGVNTSAMIDVAILGKAVCTWEEGIVGERQRRTPYYWHLRREDGGLLHVATEAEEHMEQLAALLVEAEAGVPNARSAAFVAAFVRPRGLDRPVAPLMAAEIAELAAGPTSVAAPGRVGRALGAALARGAFVLGLPLRDAPLRALAVRLVCLLLLGWARAVVAYEGRRNALGTAAKRFSVELLRRRTRWAKSARRRRDKAVKAFRRRALSLRRSNPDNRARRSSGRVAAMSPVAWRERAELADAASDDRRGNRGGELSAISTLEQDVPESGDAVVEEHRD